MTPQKRKRLTIFFWILVAAPLVAAVLGALGHKVDDPVLKALDNIATQVSGMGAWIIAAIIAMRLDAGDTTPPKK